MIQALEEFFATVFGHNVVLATIIIAMVPIIELKGAIPFAMSGAIWQGYELSFGHAFLWGLVGSSLIVPILLLIYAPLIRWLKSTKLFKKLAEKIEEKVNRKKQKVESKIEESNINESESNIANNKKTLMKVLGVFLFVAIPLPFTGVWTGSCLAVALGLNFFLGLFVVVFGNVVAGILVTVLSSVLTPLVYLLIFLGLILLVALVYLIKKLINRKNTNNPGEEEANPEDLNITWFLGIICDIFILSNCFKRRQEKHCTNSLNVF